MEVRAKEDIPIDAKRARLGQGLPGDGGLSHRPRDGRRGWRHLSAIEETHLSKATLLANVASNGLTLVLTPPLPGVPGIGLIALVKPECAFVKDELDGILWAKPLREALLMLRVRECPLLELPLEAVYDADEATEDFREGALTKELAIEAFRLGSVEDPACEGLVLEGKDGAPANAVDIRRSIDLA